MPWRCPACGNVIKHDESVSTPRVGTRYRCHLCRVGLEYRPEVNKMVIVRSDDEKPAKRRRE